MKYLSVKLALVLTILGIVAFFSNACGGAENQISGNQKPIILSISSDLANVVPEASSTITCVASDPDGDNLSYDWSTTGGSLSGTGEAVTWMAPDVVGTYSISVTVDDGRGATAIKSYAITVASEAANRPPFIVSVTAGPKSIEPNTTTTIVCVAKDPDDDLLTYRWFTGGYDAHLEGKGNVAILPPPSLVIEGTGYIVTYTAPGEFGEYDIEVTVRDDRGGRDTKTITVIVAENEPPDITKLSAKAETLIIDHSTIITCVASDPEGSSLSYTWSATYGSISGTGDVVTWTAPGEPRDCTIEVTVDDGRGGTTTSSISTQVRGIRVTTILIPVSSESGWVRSDSTIHRVWRVGDDSDDYGLRTFLSFDISKIKEVEELRSAVLTIGGITQNGTPWVDLDSLRIDEVEYGDRRLKAADYDRSGQRLETYDSPTFAEIDLTQIIKRAIDGGSLRFQMAFYFKTETDNDDSADNIKFTIAELTVDYVRTTW